MTQHPDRSTPAPTLAAGRRQAPRQLVLVRHGQSVGNLADVAAREAGSGRLKVDTRDPDTPLSETGRAQALALGDQLATLGPGDLPDIVLSSPYVRARTTAELALERAGASHQLIFDERLRERDLGALDGLTGIGIREAFPQEAERREHIGKFYYRPPGGESWTDVALRVRSLLADVRAEYDGRSVWVFSHQAVIMAFRFVLEHLDEAAVLGIDATEPLPNCSMTSYAPGEDGGLRLVEYAATGHLRASEAPLTREEPAAREPA